MYPFIIAPKKMFVAAPPAINRQLLELVARNTVANWKQMARCLDVAEVEIDEIDEDQRKV